MANATIRLVFNLTTGKKDIYIELQSDADSLPIEHEQDHRHLVEKLLGQGILQANEVGDLHVNRISQQAATTEDKKTQQPQETRTKARH